MSEDGIGQPTCDHRDHAGEDVPAVAQFEAGVPPADAIRFWACAEHAPEGMPAINRLDPGPENRVVETGSDCSGGESDAE